MVILRYSSPRNRCTACPCRISHTSYHLSCCCRPGCRHIWCRCLRESVSATPHRTPRANPHIAFLVVPPSCTNCNLPWNERSENGIRAMDQNTEDPREFENAQKPHEVYGAHVSQNMPCLGALVWPQSAHQPAAMQSSHTFRIPLLHSFLQ